MPEQQSRQNRHQNPEQVKQEYHRPGMFREKQTYQQHINRKTGAARHKGDNQHRNQPVLAALNGPGGHDGRHIAAETDNHRNERLAVQPYRMHQFVHDECHPRHIAGGFHNRNEEKQNQYIRKKHKHTASSLHDPVH